MGRRLGLAVGVLLAVPAVALAGVGVNITTAGEGFFEDDRLTVAVFDGDGATTRLVVTFGPAGPECAADPGSDPRPVVADAPASDGVVSGTAVAPDPGSYRACGWAFDGSGAVRSRSEAVEQVLSQPAEAGAGVEAPRVWRGIPLAVFANAYAKRGRLLQAAVIRGPCPATAPGATDPAVARWLSDPAGTEVGAGERRVRTRVTLAAAGPYAVCSWVGEVPGDPAPEAFAADPLTVVGERAKTRVGLLANRHPSDGRKPVRWRGTVIGAFTGTVRFEARKVVNAPSGALRGSGPWRSVAKFSLARIRPSLGIANFGLAGSAAARIKAATVLPAAIGRQCGNRSRIAQVRLRFSGTALARPATSEVVELLGSLGGCR